LRELRQRCPGTAPGKLASMESKDSFMRYVVIGSIILVGALAVLVRMHA
jgi:hypothetical protein